ncbi:secreted protein [Rhodopirellula maiorica SM1]|uniref:Secreted protein n=1 Tax=Rhodopirellula maiorica SM1 TaxID=1265738 RepID=M5RPD5_9BACT|nr:secreted protein [Rhodopirellula maiorica SM1]
MSCSARCVGRRGAFLMTGGAGMVFAGTGGDAFTGDSVVDRGRMSLILKRIASNQYCVSMPPVTGAFSMASVLGQ